MASSPVEKDRLIQIRSIIKSIIISGWILLAIITSYIIIFEYGYKNSSPKYLEIWWHFVITIFIIVLAFSFFLQTLLIEIENKNDLRNKVVHALNHEHRNYYLKNSKSNEKDSSNSFVIEKDNQSNI